MANPKERSYHQYSRHVTGALVLDKILFYKNYPRKAKTRFKDIDPTYFRDFSTGFYEGTNVLHWLERDLSNKKSLLSVSHKRAWDLLWQAILSTVEIQIAHQTQGLKSAQPEMFLQLIRDISCDEQLKSYGVMKIWVMELHHELTLEAEKGGTGFSLPTLPNYKFFGDLIIVDHFPKGPIVITYQILVNILDKIEAKMSWQYYLSAMDLIPEKQKFQIGPMFREIYKILEECYKNLGNEACRVSKSLEPLCVGSVLRLDDPVSNDHNFRGEVIASVIEKVPDAEPYINKLVQLMDNYLIRHGHDGIPYLIEQYGQEKLHNYPITSGEEGMKKMYRYGTSYRPITMAAVNEITACFKREYFVAYFDHHKILPKVLMTQRLDPRIRKLIEAGKPGSIRECCKIPDPAWLDLEFDKNHSFNYYPQVSDLLDDKALTPHLDHIYQLFAQDALDVIHQVKPRDQEQTRLILEILRRDVIDIREFYKTVEALGYIPTNWALIQLMAKERELKIEARVFSILTFECRMMASACERNLGEQILPLFKQQSMTLTGAQLRSKMDSLATLPKTQDFLWERFEMDLEQWNFTFRSFQQAGMLDVLCNLFGVDHFRYMTQIFTDAMFVSASAFMPPGMPGAFTHWDCHAGGNQGILQKFWTLMTIITIRKVMHELDFEHRLTGSGDNQVLFVKLPRNDSLGPTIDLIKKKLAQAFEDIGLSLKLEETWTSDNLTCYQRAYYYNGMKLPGGIKLTGRAFAGVSDVNCGINSVVTTAINGGLGLNEQQSNPIVGLVYALLEIFMNLLFNPAFNKHTPLDAKQLVTLTWLSSDFGFLPMQLLSTFLYAGHQDTLSESFSLLNFVWLNYPEYRMYISGAVTFKLGECTPETKLQLILEPTSLNINRPKLPEALLREAVEEFLLKSPNVRNIQLKTMFQGCQKQDQLALATELLKITPINTALLHSLFEYSHIGSLLGTLSRFNRISSIVKLVGMNKTVKSDKCFSAQVRQLDETNLKYYFNRLKPTPSMNNEFISEVVASSHLKYQQFCSKHYLNPDCVFSLRLFLIPHTYGLGLELITGPYTPPPGEQLIMSSDMVDQIGSSDIMVTPSYNIPDTLTEIESQRGCYSLYIGSRTGDPVKSVKLHSLDGIEYGKAIKELIKIMAWIKVAGGDQNVLDLVRQTLNIRMEGLADILTNAVPGTAGGNMAHRFCSPGTVMWAFINSPTLISTWYHLSTNLAKDLQRGEEDRFIFFQQLFHHIYGALRFCAPIKHRFAIQVRLDHCSYLIPEAKFSSPLLNVPGKSVINTALVLDEQKRAELLIEAEHYESVMSNSGLKTFPPSEILASLIGVEVGHIVISHSMESNNDDLEDHRIGSSGTPFNLSVIRKIPLPTLLSHVAFYLASIGFFGKRITPNRLQLILKRRSHLGLMGQSMTALVPFINAILTAGYLQELISYSKSSWDWTGDRQTVHLIKPLYAGMNRALQDSKSKRKTLILTVEVKGSQYNYSRVMSFLRSWVRPFSKLEENNNHLTRPAFFTLFNQQPWTVKVLLLTDVGIGLEYARRTLSVPDTPQSNAMRLLLIPVIEPSFIIPNAPAWILSKVEVKQNRTDNEDLRTMATPVDRLLHSGSKHLTNLIRWNSSTSRGAHKIAELIARTGITLSAEDAFVCLADGLGGFSSYLSHCFPNSIGIFNTLLVPDSIPPSLMGLNIPPCLSCPCNRIANILNIPDNSSVMGDLTNPLAWIHLTKEVQKANRKVGLCTLDAEWNVKSMPLIFSNLCKYCIEWEPEALIVKVTLEFILADRVDILSQLVSLFTYHLWIKPTSSNPFSNEVYLVLRHFDRNSSQVAFIDYSSLFDYWTPERTISSKSRLGKTLVEGLMSSAQTTYCPGYLTPTLRSRIDQVGALIALLEPYITQLFDLIYRRYCLSSRLDKSEQIVTKSLSTQQNSTSIQINAINQTLLIYGNYIGGCLSDSFRLATLESITNNPIPFLKAIESSAVQMAHDTSISLMERHIGLLLSHPSNNFGGFQTILIEAWTTLIAEEDKFQLVTRKVADDLQSMARRLVTPFDLEHMRWWKALLRPSLFVNFNKAFQKLLFRIGKPKAYVTTAYPELRPIIESLPWAPELRIDEEMPLVIVNSFKSLESRSSSVPNYLTVCLISENCKNIMRGEGYQFIPLIRGDDHCAYLVYSN